MKRRDLLAGGGLALTLGSFTAAQGQDLVGHPLADVPAPPQLAWEFTARFRWVNGRNVTGRYRTGQRIYNTVAGGTFEGWRMKGEILAGGGDWATMNPPNASLAGPTPGRAIIYDARYILRTDDGVHIYVVNHGGKFDEPAPPAGIRPRPNVGTSQPVFDVPVGSAYEFLSRNIFVGISQAFPDATIMNVFRVVP